MNTRTHILNGVMTSSSIVALSIVTVAVKLHLWSTGKKIPPQKHAVYFPIVNIYRLLNGLGLKRETKETRIPITLDIFDKTSTFTLMFVINR